MTEAEWLACADPQPMLEFLRGKGDRKLRLFSVGFCRTEWNNLRPLDEAQNAVIVAERWADQLASQDDIDAASRPLAPAMPFAVRGIFLDAYSAAEVATHTGDVKRERQTRLLHCIFGPLPFRSITFDPTWLTPTVINLAQAIYDDRAFDRMPILADALEDAGCTNQDILSHCRQPGVHVRGCWVVDLLLDKE